MSAKIKNAFIFLFATGLMAFAASPTWAEKDKAGLQTKIGAKRQQVQALDARQRKVLSELDATKRALAAAKKRAGRLKKQIDGSEKEISLAKASLKQVTKQVGLTELYAGKRLAGYYKLTQTGLAPVILGSNSFFEASVRQRALERVIDIDRQTWDKLSKDKIRLKESAASLESGLESKRGLERKLQKEVTAQTKEESKAKDLLAGVTREKDLARAALAALENAAKELDKKMRAIKLEPAPVEEKPDDSPPSGLALDDSGPAFGSMKGKLAMPVEDGVIRAPFGDHKDPKFKAARFRSGVELKAEVGEPFHSVFRGKVVYAGWFKGYGNMIIIDHGQSYFSISAHAEDLFKEKGDVVDEGEVIGTVGDTGSFSGPGLYFELRRHSKALDPANWLRKEN